MAALTLTGAVGCSKVGRDLLAWLRLMVNHRDALALTRVYNSPPRGLGEKSWESLRAQVEGAGGGSTLSSFLFGDVLDTWVEEAAVQEVRMHAARLLCTMHACQGAHTQHRACSRARTPRAGSAQRLRCSAADARSARERAHSACVLRVARASLLLSTMQRSTAQHL